MVNNLNFNLSEKFFIKNILDAFILFAVFTAFAILKIVNASLVHTFLTITIMFVIALILQIAVNLWINDILNKSVIQKSRSVIQDNDVLKDLFGKQKQNLENYSNKTSEYVKSIKTLKENMLSINSSYNLVNNFIKTLMELINKKKEFSEANKDNIEMLKEHFHSVSEVILQLTEYNQQIISNISIVESLAEQTNMLALNATVEAARAGEHGKGFAIVAGEIRKLADETKNSANKISSLINEAQNMTQSTIMDIEVSSKKFETILSTDTDLIEEINSLINPIENNLKTISLSINDEICSEVNNSIIGLNNRIQQDLEAISNTFEFSGKKMN